MASHLVHARGLIIAVLITMLPLAAEAVSIPNWPDVPPVCLPSRVAKDSKIDGCVCPPQSMCPSIGGITNMQQLIDASVMPPALTMACCSLPVCPAGTKLEGQPLPADGVCDCLCAKGTDHAGVNVASCNDTVGPVCPAGSDHAGQTVAHCNDSPKPDVPVACAPGTDHAGENVASCNNPVSPICPVQCPAGFAPAVYDGPYQSFQYGAALSGALGHVHHNGCLPVCSAGDSWFAETSLNPGGGVGGDVNHQGGIGVGGAAGGGFGNGNGGVRGDNGGYQDESR